MRENKCEIICIRLTRTERDLLDEICEEKSSTPSRIIRRLLNEKFAEKYDLKVPNY